MSKHFAAPEMCAIVVSVAQIKNNVVGHAGEKKLNWLRPAFFATYMA